MSQYRHAVPRRKPPRDYRMRWSHPLWRGLLICIPYNEGAGFPRERITGLPIGVGTGGAFTWSMTDEGRGFGEGGFTYHHEDYPRVPTAFPFTIHVRGRANAGNNGSGRTMTAIMSNDLSHQSGVGFSSTDGTPFMRCESVTLTGTPVGVGPIVSMVGVFTSTTSRTLYVDGKVSATDSTSVTLGSMAALFTWSTAAQTFADLLFSAVWDRALSEQEIRHLAAYPYDLLEPPYRHAGKAGAAVPPSLSLMGASVW